MRMKEKKKGNDPMNDCTIRLEKKEDYRATENLIWEAFWNVYRPGCSEHYVMHCGTIPPSSRS